MFKYLAIGIAFLSVVLAQRRQAYQQSQTAATTPVPILRQINTHNQDGSYTYGYEGADGTYKIENKAANGEVKGKYGYYDDVGQLREIEYGANRDGFNPSGTGINVPPPAPVSRNYNSAGTEYDDDGSYKPEQHTYPYDYIPETVGNALTSPQSRRLPSSRNFNFQNQPVQQHQQQQSNYYQPEEYVQPAPVVRQQPRTRPAYQIEPGHFQGHPASNINLNSGSYNINY